jgi:hypothetical protein
VRFWSNRLRLYWLWGGLYRLGLYRFRLYRFRRRLYWFGLYRLRLWGNWLDERSAT